MAILDEPEPPKRSGGFWMLVVLAIGLIVLAFAGYKYFSSTARPAPAAVRPMSPAVPARPAPQPAAPVQPQPAERPRPRAPRREAAAPKPAAPAPAPAPTTGTVTIESDVPGALVFVDRKYLGKTPITQPDLTPGAHQLNVSVQGYDPYSSTIDVKPGPQQVAVTFKQVTLHEQIAVVHKHAFGSCKGTLVATPDGLQYDTTDTHDAFKVPFSRVDGFTVDYLKNNLEIKVRGGRTYNFTEQTGGPDTLFVFHRDVQKAIDMLKKLGELK